MVCQRASPCVSSRALRGLRDWIGARFSYEGIPLRRIVNKIQVGCTNCSLKCAMPGQDTMDAESCTHHGCRYLPGSWASGARGVYMYCFSRPRGFRSVRLSTCIFLMIRPLYDRRRSFETDTLTITLSSGNPMEDTPRDVTLLIRWGCYP